MQRKSTSQLRSLLTVCATVTALWSCDEQVAAGDAGGGQDAAGGDAARDSSADARPEVSVDGSRDGTVGDAADGSSDAAEPPGPLSEEEAMARLRELSPQTLPPAPADPTNAWADDAAAASFGKKLFFEPRFAGPLLDGDNDGSEHALGKQGEVGKVACSGCHVPEDGFSDTRSIRQQISLAAGWGFRKTPSLLDSGQSKLLMWDGRFDSFHAQVFGPLESPLEMNSSRLFAAKRIFELYRDEYEALFGPMPPLGDDARFPEIPASEVGCSELTGNRECAAKMRGVPGDGAEYDSMTPEDQRAVTRVWINAGKAMGAYQRQLTCGQSRFDAWIHGDADALTAAERRGAKLFVGKGDCVRCHSGPYLSDEKFHNVGLQAVSVATVFLNANDPGARVGLAELLEDPLNSAGVYSDGQDGRLPEKVLPEHLGAFRTPRLRCVASRPSFMHTGQFTDLGEVVAFFARGGDEFGFVGDNELVDVDLSLEERADLVAFLRALEGPGPEPELLEAPE